MKNNPVSLLAALMIATTTAFAADAVVHVESPAAPRESRRTLGIAPSSAVNRNVATYAATQLSPLVAGTKVFTVAPTGSMRPLFDENSVLLVEPASFASLQIGDIVVYRHTGMNKLIVHRILEQRSGGFWTKGDHNNGMDDELVTAANYQGRVYGILYTARSRQDALPGAVLKGGTLTASAR